MIRQRQLVHSSSNSIQDLENTGFEKEEEEEKEEEKDKGGADDGSASNNNHKLLESMGKRAWRLFMKWRKPLLLGWVLKLLGTLYIALVYYFMTPAEVWNPKLLGDPQYIVSCETFTQQQQQQQQLFHSKKFHVGIVTFQRGLEEEIVNITIENKRLYAAHHGYDLIIADDLVKQGARPAAWEKFPILLSVLETNKYDFVMWIDTDAIFMNFTIAVDWVANSKGATGDLVLSSDENGLNSGVFILRNTEWSRWFLRECDSQFKYFGDPLNRYIPFQYEQRALHYMFLTPIFERYLETNHSIPKYEHTEKVISHTLFVKPCALNTNACEEFKTAIFLFRGRQIFNGFFCDNPYHNGDYIIHLAGKQPKMYRNYILKGFAASALEAFHKLY